MRGIYQSSVDSPHKGPVILSIPWCHHELYENKMWPPNPDFHTWSVWEAIWVTLVNVPPSWTCHHHDLDKVMPSSEVNQQKALNFVPQISLIIISNVVSSVKMYLIHWPLGDLTTVSNKYNNWCKASKLIAPAITTIWSQIFKMGSWKKTAMQNCLLCY